MQRCSRIYCCVLLCADYRFLLFQVKCQWRQSWCSPRTPHQFRSFVRLRLRVYPLPLIPVLLLAQHPPYGLFLGKFLLHFLATRSFFSLSLWSLVANACIKACIYFSFWTVHKGEMLAVEDLSVCMKIEMARLLWIHELLLQNDPFFFKQTTIPQDYIT